MKAEGISTKKFFNIEDTSLKGFDAKLQICSRVRVDTFFWLLKLYKGKYVLIDMSHNPKVFCTNRCLMLLIISCYFFLRWALFLNIPEKWHNFGGVKFNNFNHPILEYLDVSWLPKTIQFNIWFWRSNTLLYWLQEQQQKHVWRKLSVKVAGNKEKLYSFNYHFLFLQYFAQWSYQNNIEINQYI